MDPRSTWRNTGIVVVIMAVFLGYIFLVEVNKTPEQLGTPFPTLRPSVLELKADNVKSIEVRDLRATREVRLTRVENNWQVDQPIQKAADTPTVNTTLDGLANLRASRVITNVTDIAPYGLNPASLEVRLIMTDTTPYAITIGDKTPDGGSYYAVYTGDKSKVFLLDTSTVDGLEQWLANPPYEPTPTPTYTPSLTPTATVPVTETPKAEGTPAAGSTPATPNATPPPPAPSPTP